MEERDWISNATRRSGGERDWVLVIGFGCVLTMTLALALALTIISAWPQ
jgi:hypothetical protein